MKRDEVKQAYSVTAIISGALALSAFFYLAVLYILEKQGALPLASGMEEGTIRILTYGCYGLAGMSFLGVQVFRRVSLAKKSGEDISVRLTRLRTLSIVSLAAAEASAILGLLLGVMGGAYLDVFILFGISLFMFALYFPRLERWQSYVVGSHDETSAAGH